MPSPFDRLREVFDFSVRDLTDNKFRLNTKDPDAADKWVSTMNQAGMEKDAVTGSPPGTSFTQYFNETVANSRSFMPPEVAEARLGDPRWAASEMQPTFAGSEGTRGPAGMALRALSEIPKFAAAQLNVFEPAIAPQGFKDALAAERAFIHSVPATNPFAKFGQAVESGLFAPSKAFEQSRGDFPQQPVSQEFLDYIGDALAATSLAGSVLDVATPDPIDPKQPQFTIGLAEAEEALLDPLNFLGPGAIAPKAVAQNIAKGVGRAKGLAGEGAGAALRKASDISPVGVADAFADPEDLAAAARAAGGKPTRILSPSEDPKYNIFDVDPEFVGLGGTGGRLPTPERFAELVRSANEILQKPLGSLSDNEISRLGQVRANNATPPSVKISIGLRETQETASRRGKLFTAEELTNQFPLEQRVVRLGPNQTATIEELGIKSGAFTRQADATVVDPTAAARGADVAAPTTGQMTLGGRVVPSATEADIADRRAAQAGFNLTARGEDAPLQAAARQEAGELPPTINPETGQAYTNAEYNALLQERGLAPEPAVARTREVVDGEISTVTSRLDELDPLIQERQADVRIIRPSGFIGVTDEEFLNLADSKRVVNPQGEQVARTVDPYGDRDWFTSLDLEPSELKFLREGGYKGSRQGQPQNITALRNERTRLRQDLKALQEERAGIPEGALAPDEPVDVGLGISASLTEKQMENLFAGETRYFTQAFRSTKEEIEKTFASGDAEAMQRVQQRYLNLSNPAKERVQKVLEDAGFTGFTVEPNLGLYQGSIEPSLYVSGTVSRDRLDELTRIAVDAADTDFAQESVIVWRHADEAEIDMARPWGAAPDGAAPGEIFEPAESITFSRAATQDEIQRLYKLAEENDVAGFSTHADRQGMDLIHLSEYDKFIKEVKAGADPYEFFVRNVKRFKDAIDGDTQLRGLTPVPQLNLRSVRHYGATAEDAAETYGDFRRYHSAQETAGTPTGADVARAPTEQLGQTRRTRGPPDELDDTEKVVGGRPDVEVPDVEAATASAKAAKAAKKQDISAPAVRTMADEFEEAAFVEDDPMKHVMDSPDPPVAVTPELDIEALRRYGFEPGMLETGLTRREMLWNAAKRSIAGKDPRGGELKGLSKKLGGEADPLTDRVFDVVDTIEENAGHLRDATLGRIIPKMNRAFVFAEDGTIPALANNPDILPYAPTIQDVAAKYPAYKKAKALTPAQIEVLDDMQENLQFMGRALRAAGEEFSERADILPDGFYIPRGGDGDHPLVGAALRRTRGAPIPETREAPWDSMGEAIANGHEYDIVDDAIGALIIRAGNRISDLFVVETYRKAADEFGQKLGMTRKELVKRDNPVVWRRMNQLQKDVENLKSLIAGKDKQLNRLIHRFRHDPAFASEIENFDQLKRAIDSAKIVQRGPRAGQTTPVLRNSLRSLKKEMANFKPVWNRALENAPRNAKGVKYAPMSKGFDYPQLNGRLFPERMANRTIEQVEARAAGSNRGFLPLEIADEIMRIWKGLNSTVDHSGVGIQALLSSWDNPKRLAIAFPRSLQAFGTPGAYADWATGFNARATRQGGFTVDEMAGFGLAQLEQAPEVASGLLQAGFRIPKVGRAAGAPFRGFDRMFSSVGNIVRAEQAYDDIMLQMALGKSKEDLIKSGAIRDIVDAANVSTGYVKGNFTVANLIMFSARFFSARVTQLLRAARGLDIDAPLDLVPIIGGRIANKVPTVNKAARLQDKIARRQILRMMGYGTMLTVAVNTMNGHDTDFRMVVKDSKGRQRYNSNFVRIIGKNRDYSVFGPYDSMLRLFTNVVLFKGKDTVETLANNPFVSASLDLFENEKFGGAPIVDPNMIDPGLRDKATNAARMGMYIFETMLPFSTDETTNIMSDAIKNVEQGDKGAAAADLGDMLLEFGGVKSSPKSNQELRDLIADPKTRPEERSHLQDILDARQAEWRKFDKPQGLQLSPAHLERRQKQLEAAR